jgi:hypothetical protein
MNNAESNDPKEKQNAQAAQSPIKTPSAETAHVQSGDAHTAAAGGEAHAGAHAKQPRRDPAAYADTEIGPDGLREQRPRGADVVNDDTLDDTVDADGKNIQAKRYDQMLEDEPDAVINNNATPVNYVDTPDDGLGGFDSRKGRNGLLLMLERGYRMIDRGMVAPSVKVVEEQLTFETRDAHGHKLRGRRHYALNHLRPSRLFEIEQS